ncbi:MAG: hypothetical protein ACEY3D_00840 [Rickettsia sp.]
MDTVVKPRYDINPHQ